MYFVGFPFLNEVFTLILTCASCSFAPRLSVCVIHHMKSSTVCCVFLHHLVRMECGIVFYNEQMLESMFGEYYIVQKESSACLRDFQIMRPKGNHLINLLKCSPLLQFYWIE